MRPHNLTPFTRTQHLRRIFGITPRPLSTPPQLDQTVAQLIPYCQSGTLTLITGPSGSGKSLLMRRLAEQFGLACSCSDELTLPDLPVIDCLYQLELEEALELLSRFGLAEVHTYLAYPHQLSAGQRFRLKLALAYAHLLHPRRTAHPVPCLLADEFATTLDRISARIIARNFARTIRASQICAIVATCHDDLADALNPDLVIACDFNDYTIHHIVRSASRK